MKSKKLSSRIIIIVNSLIMIFLIFLTPFHSCNFKSKNNFMQDNQRIIDDSARINNLQVPFISLDVAVKDSYAYIPNYNSIKYYDLEELKYKGKFRDYYNELYSFQEINQIEIQDNYMYLLSDYGYNSQNSFFWIAEYLGSSSIVILGNHTFNATNAGRMVTYEHILRIQDNYAFIGTNWYNTTVNDQIISLITIIDISNKSNPIEVSSFNETGICSDLVVNDDKLYLAVGHQKKHNYTDGTYEVFGEDKIVVLDISIKSQPTKISQFNLSFKPISLSMKNNYLFLSYYDSDFEIFDFSDNLNPILLVSSKTFSRKIILENNLVYVLGNEKLTIFDITDVNNLNKIVEKQVRYRGENGRFLDGIFTDNLVLAVRSVLYYGSFIIFNCSNIKRPKIVYPEIDMKSLRFSLALIIVGYIISPLVLLSLSAITIKKLIRKKRTKAINIEKGV